MTSNTLTPIRRFQVAGLGYLLLALAPQWTKWGTFGLLAGVVASTIFGLLALRAAAPGLADLPRENRTSHPIEAGKKRLTKRQRLAMRDQI